MKIAVCDDESESVRDLSGKLSEYAAHKQLDYRVIAYDCGEKLLIEIGKIAFDIIFLDIKMKQINGIETAKKIRTTNTNVIIIFVSALKDYVFDAFDVDAMQFIVKPIEVSKLYSVLDKATQKLNQAKNNVLTIYKNNEMKKLAFTDILYCEVLNHSVFIYENESIHEYVGKIDDLEKEFSEDFFRCHRSYIIHLAWVQSYKNGFAYLPSGEKIPIATRRQGDFMRAILKYQRNEMR